MPTAIGKMVVRDSELGPHIRVDAPWAAWGTRTSPWCSAKGDQCSSKTLVLFDSSYYYAPGSDPHQPAEVYLSEYRNVGPGAAPVKQ